MIGLGPLYKRGLTELPAASPCEDTVRGQQPATQGSLTLGLPASRTGSDPSLQFVSHLV